MKNKIKINILPSLIIILASVFFMCGSIAPGQTIKEWAGRGALIVDVRTPAEYAAGNIPGSINIPLQDIQGRLNEFGSKEGYIIVYCRTGNRSGKAKTFLESQGYRNVINGGGLQNMIKALQ